MSEAAPNARTLTAVASESCAGGFGHCAAACGAVTVTWPRRFFRAAAKPIAVAWQLAAGGDLALPEIEGPRPLSVRVANAYTDWVLTACESDAVVAGQFLKVNGLLDPLSRLLHPAFVYRVATVNLRRGRCSSESRWTRPTNAAAWQ